jgi:multidrug efflux pump subunit AcrA (membrane-fusion protein)
VARFADKVDEQTRTMQTEVDVKNADLALVPGMYASVALTLAAKTGVLTVPVQAVDRAENSTNGSVLVVDPGGRLELRPIALGLETPNRIEVQSGLKENDLVVIGSRSQLKPGSPVVPKLEKVAASSGEK